MNHLLHPEYFESIPIVGPNAALRLDGLADRVEAETLQAAPGITIGLRTWEDAKHLEGLFEDISKQEWQRRPYPGSDVQVIVADRRSIDGSATIARYHGAEVISGVFTNPEAMNLIMERASHRLVYHLRGGRLSTDQAFNAAGRVFANNPLAAGAFARVLPGPEASRIEKFYGIGNRLLYMRERQTKKASLGVLASQNCVVAKDAWKEVGKFDERYITGGADTALARLALAANLTIHEEPVVAAHYSNGVGLRDAIRLWRHWMRTLERPVPASELGSMRHTPLTRKLY